MKIMIFRLDVIQKVNGVEKTGLQIRKKGVSSGILVYPEDVYVGSKAEAAVSRCSAS